MQFLCLPGLSDASGRRIGPSEASERNAGLCGGLEPADPI
jgi:hypothetical protein